MKISISSSFNYKYPIEDQIKLIALAGFTHISFGANLKHFDYTDPARQNAIKTLLDKNGLKVDTLHAPSLDKDEMLDVFKKSINAAIYFEAPVIVTHICPFEFALNELELRQERIFKTIKRLEGLFSSSGIYLGLENVFPGHADQLIISVLEKTESAYVGFCYDSSHDQIGGPKPFHLLNKLQNKLVAVHLSDRIKEFVDHVIPGEGIICWPKMLAILKEIKYNSSLLFEVMMEHSKFNNVSDFLNETQRKGREFNQFIKSSNGS